MLCFPLFSYAGVVGTASGMVDLKDIKPLLNMLRPSTRTLMVRITLGFLDFVYSQLRVCVSKFICEPQLQVQETIGTARNSKDRHHPVANGRKVCQGSTYSASAAFSFGTLSHNNNDNFHKYAYHKQVRRFDPRKTRASP